VVLWSLSLDDLVLLLTSREDLLLPSRDDDEVVFLLRESLAEPLGFLRDVEDFLLLLPLGVLCGRMEVRSASDSSLNSCVTSSRWRPGLPPR
jgi:hypothetical protein